MPATNTALDVLDALYASAYGANIRIEESISGCGIQITDTDTGATRFISAPALQAIIQEQATIKLTHTGMDL